MFRPAQVHPKSALSRVPALGTFIGLPLSRWRQRSGGVVTHSL
jgi:hypothetical protein